MTAVIQTFFALLISTPIWLAGSAGLADKLSHTSDIDDKAAMEIGNRITADVWSDLCVVRHLQKPCSIRSYYKIDVLVAPESCFVTVTGKDADAHDFAHHSPYIEWAQYECLTDGRVVLKAYM